MCAIAGLFGSDPQRVAQMVERMRHRGPDCQRVHVLPELGGAIGHARLAIIDLDPRSHQPFESPCGRWSLVFNGEIYNHAELRARLEQDGVRFSTSSDTEVLLHWISRRGAAGLADLDGMYAFCLVDRRHKRLLLARDPLGEKPLYYALGGPRQGWRFAFASELKALGDLPELDRSLDMVAVRDWLRFLYTPAPRTLWQGARELAPGHWLEIDLSAPRDRQVRHYDLEQRVNARVEQMSASEAVARTRDALAQAVRSRLLSDTEVGVYLSAGLDSNAILGAARANAPHVNPSTFTLTYVGTSEARAQDEGALAARAASWHGVKNVQLAHGSRADLLGSALQTLDVFDQPFGNATCVVALRLAEQASRSVRVCLVGDGGDEIFAGYPRYRALLLHERLQRLPLGLRAFGARAAHALPESGRLAIPLRRLRHFASGLQQPRAEAFVDWSSYLDEHDLASALGPAAPTEFHGSLVALFERHAHAPLRAAALVDLHSFVPYNLLQAADRTGMAHGLELRVPLLAPDLVERVVAMPDEHKLHARRPKPLLADALHSALPPFLRVRKKRAFQPPMQGWIRHGLAEIERHLLRPEAEVCQLLERRFVQAQVDAFRRGESDNSTLLWALAGLETWLARERAPLASSMLPDALIPRPPAGRESAQSSLARPAA